MTKKNTKSDVLAKEAFIAELQKHGFQARVTAAPADITAEKDGETWYFEIKMTKRTDSYFGGATQTEWRQALKNPQHFRFVVAKTDEEETTFEFLQYTPEEFMAFSTIPPFKIFFNINFNKPNQKHTTKKTKSKAIPMTSENFNIIDEAFNAIKE